MEKNFDAWNIVKKKNHFEKERPFFHQREIWSCNLGVNIGFEQDGSGDDFMRPVVVIKKFSKEVCWVIPLTKSNKTGKYYFSFSFIDKVVSSAILSQLTLLDSKRLYYKIGDIDANDFKQIIERTINLFP